MNKSESISKIATALVAAQKSIGAAVKGTENKFFQSRYADLGSVMAVCKEPLLSQGIAVLQLVNYDESGATVETMLLHSSGEFIASLTRVNAVKKMIRPKKDEPQFEPFFSYDPQGVGSAITYARRYALQALVFIPSVDDDAEWAAHAEQQRPTAEQQAENLKEAIASRGGEIIEPPAEKEFTKWQDVICHVGQDTKKPDGTIVASKIRGKTLGELGHKLRAWVSERIDKLTPTKSVLDKKLIAALALAIADDQIPGLDASKTPAIASEPEKATDAPPESQTKQEAPPEPKTPILRASQWTWKSVKVPTGAAKGKRLGDMPPEHQRSCWIFGAPRCAGQTQEEKDFIEGVNAMGEEMRYEQSPEYANCRKVVELAHAAGADSKQLDAALIEGGVLEKGQTFPKCDAEMVAHILNNWTGVEEILKGAKK